MGAFFTGWLGYGTAVAAGTLIEPSDSAYVRRPIVLGWLENGIVADVGGGTVGPAAAPWGSIGYAGLFDSVSGGNLLLWMPLALPGVIAGGMTITTGPGDNRLLFADLRSGGGNRVWPAGSVVATTPDGRSLTAGVPLQLSGGVMSAQALQFGATVTMASLPTAQPVSGSGQLWNNGGVISVA